MDYTVENLKRLRGILSAQIGDIEDMLWLLEDEMVPESFIGFHRLMLEFENLEIERIKLVLGIADKENDDDREEGL